MTATGKEVLRKRLVEYLGGMGDLDSVTARYLVESDRGRFQIPRSCPVGDLERLLGGDGEIARSLSDSESLLVHLDLEYVDFDHPEAAYVDPWRAFRLQEPTVAAVEEVLLEWGIAPLHLVTGQGHHLVWRIRLDSPTCRRLAELGSLPGGVISPFGAEMGAGIDPVSEREAAAFGGLGLVVEFLAHSVRRRAAPASEVPVQITGVHVGPCGTERRREIVSFDISEYGDPMGTRVIRMPFTRYEKPWKSGLAQGLGIEEELPSTVITIPLHEIDIGRALQLRQVESEVEELARRASVAIPEQEGGTSRMIDAYLASPLRKFHEYYYAVGIGDVADFGESGWEGTLGRLPPCAAHVVREPNDLLLKPAGIELVARSLLAEGWHPRHIAGCVRSVYADPGYGWGEMWDHYDMGMRADFYVRLFSGLVLTGLDGLVDFNCVSSGEKGFCFDGYWGCTLDVARRRLLERETALRSTFTPPNELK